MKSFVF